MTKTKIIYSRFLVMFILMGFCTLFCTAIGEQLRLPINLSFILSAFIATIMFIFNKDIWTEKVLDHARKEH